MSSTKIGKMAAAAACASVTVAYLALQPFRGPLYVLSGISEAAFSLIPVLLSFYALKTRTPFSKSTRWLAFGFLLWSLGEFTWSFYALILGIAIPYPSLADVFWLAAYPFVLIGMVAFLLPFKSSINRRNLLVSSAVSLLAVGLVVGGLVLPVLTYSTDMVSNVVGLAYPMLDIALLFASIMGILLFWGGRIARGFYWLVAGAILMAVADILFSYLTAIGTYYDGHPLELFYEFSYVCFGLCIYNQLKGLWE